MFVVRSASSWPLSTGALALGRSGARGVDGQALVIGPSGPTHALGGVGPLGTVARVEGDREASRALDVEIGKSWSPLSPPPCIEKGAVRGPR